MQASTRLKGIKGSNFEVDLEYNDQLIFIHLPHIEKLTKSTITEWRVLLKDWYPFFKTMGYETLFAAVPQGSTIEKALPLIGFEFLAIADDYAIYAVKE
jgi:hypothetical protein